MDRNKAMANVGVDIQPQPIQRCSGSILTFEKGQVRKRQGLARAKAEYRRTSIALRIAQETKKFRVPKILSFDEQSGEIVFECVSDMETYLQILRNIDKPERLVQRAGEVLGTIHLSKICQQDNRNLSKTGKVFSHGDFGLENILYVAERDELFIIDWGVAYWVNHLESDFWNYPSLDISVFLLSLFYRRPFSHNPIPQVHNLARVFLNTYIATRIDLTTTDIVNLLQMLSSELTLRVQQYHDRAKLSVGRIKAWFYYPSLFDLQRFIKSLKAENL